MASGSGNRENPGRIAESGGQDTGCIVCGAPLQYFELPEKQTCEKCRRTVLSDARCSRGHFVCDLCHKQDPIEVVRKICATSKETNMLRMMSEIRRHPAFKTHGPEHHSLVPGVILATYRNLGGKIDPLQIQAAIDRGGLLPGGACGYMGSCGAAIGAGIAFSTILGATPLRSEPRQSSQKITARILDRIADINAARCCRRECYIALMAAAELSHEYLPIALHASEQPECDTFELNQECPGAMCPFFPAPQKR